MRLSEVVSRILSEIEPKLKSLGFEINRLSLRYFVSTGGHGIMLNDRYVRGLVYIVEDILFRDASIRIIERNEKRAIAIVERIYEYRGVKRIDRYLIVMERDIDNMLGDLIITACLI